MKAVSPNVHVLGGGPVGSLLGLSLCKKGFRTNLYESRPDPRLKKLLEGRSINLALSHRGIRTLKDSGVYEKILPMLIPMQGRMIHDIGGGTTVQPYGNEGECIYSVSRSRLNELLITEAEQAGVKFHFGSRCTSVSLESRSFLINDHHKVSYDYLIGADGANSVLRESIDLASGNESELEVLDYQYKELMIQAKDEEFQISPHYLHIWPRNNFMLIALPNKDRSFTCTLFLPQKGNCSFESISSPKDLHSFFSQYFTDAYQLIPDLTQQFDRNPTASLATLRCQSWCVDKCLIIGDASHAIVPFFGQGMNAGFEDIRILLSLLENQDKWDRSFKLFETLRKPDTQAIGRLALENFIEMRDTVANDHFLKIKKLEARLQSQFPKEWIPLYSMVTFSDMPYREAEMMGNLQKHILSQVPEGFDVATYNIDPLIKKLNALRLDAQKAFR